MPIISVIIPTFNREHCVTIAIASVLNQSYQDFELIIVDDASQDNTSKVIHSILDPRIRYVAHDENRGAAASRNTGVRAAKGEYIAFLDSDDEWDKDKLLYQYTALKNAKNMELVSCTGFVLNLLDEAKTTINDLSHHSNIHQSILEGCDLSPGSTFMSHKIVFDMVGYFDENLARLEDWDWLLRYRSKDKILLLQKLLTIVNNKRGREGDALETSIKKFILKHKKLYNQLGCLQKRRIFSNIWLQAAGTYLREKRILKALKTLIIAHFYNPFVILQYYLKKKEYSA